MFGGRAVREHVSCWHMPEALMTGSTSHSPCFPVSLHCPIRLRLKKKNKQKKIFQKYPTPMCNHMTETGKKICTQMSISSCKYLHMISCTHENYMFFICKCGSLVFELTVRPVWTTALQRMMMLFQWYINLNLFHLFVISDEMSPNINDYGFLE